MLLIYVILRELMIIKNFYGIHVLICSSLWSRENEADLEAKLKIASSAGSKSNIFSGSYTEQSLFQRTISYEGFESDSEFEFNRTYKTREEERSRSPPNERAYASPSASECLAAGTRPRGRPRKDLGVTHKHKSECSRSTQSTEPHLPSDDPTTLPRPPFITEIPTGPPPTESIENILVGN